MSSKEEIKDLIEKFNSNERQKTFAEFIAVLLKDKMVEIYMGDSYEEVSVEQISMSYPAVFCGKIVGAFKECLVLDSYYVSVNKNKVKEQLPGNLVFINERGIRALTEIDGQGTVNDLFTKSGLESAKHRIK
jgi:hypothetical protein